MSVAVILLALSLACISSTHEDHKHDEHEPAQVSNTSSGISWPQGAVLKKMTGVDLKWNSSDPEFLHMEMSSKTSGYVGVGFCPKWNGTMAGCDIVIGWVDDDTMKPHLYDYHADSNASPILDKSQDYELVSASQVDFLTVIQFKRKWNTTDEQDASLDGNVQLIWSWHPSDPKSSEGIPAHDKNTRGHTDIMVAIRTSTKSAGVVSECHANMGVLIAIVNVYLLSLVW